MRSEKYSKDLAVLIALISNLAYTTPLSRKSPDKLAKDLSIDEATIGRVLKSYKSLFKEEKNLNDNPEERGRGIFIYGLHLRYALSVQDRKNGERSRDPLATEHVTALISFVTQMATDERSFRSQFFTALLATITAIGVAFIALRGNVC